MRAVDVDGDSDGISRHSSSRRSSEALNPLIVLLQHVQRVDQRCVVASFRDGPDGSRGIATDGQDGYSAGVTGYCQRGEDEPSGRDERAKATGCQEIEESDIVRGRPRAACNRTSSVKRRH